TDALGRSQSFTLSGAGALKTVTDEYGRTTTFTPGGPHNQPLSFTDARGIPTRYGYDAAGNLTDTTYPDRSIERIAYDAVGDPTTLVNRREQAITLTYNADGQVKHELFPDGSTQATTYDARRRPETVTTADGITR